MQKAEDRVSRKFKNGWIGENLMCLAIPAKLIRIDEQMGTVDMDGTQRDVSLLLLQDVKIGDYLIVHAGFAIHRVDEAEALASLKILREMAALPEARKPLKFPDGYCAYGQILFANALTPGARFFYTFYDLLGFKTVHQVRSSQNKSVKEGGET